jgi:prophage antirepressor-like protein/Holliday junction resolvase RusA-like endonuclease
MVFESNEVEVIVVDAEVMFEVYSTGMALGYVTSNGYAYKKRIDKVLTNAEISTFSQGVKNYMTEEQLYDFMLEARTEKCKVFRKWVTTEVLPSIRKAGCYIHETATTESIDFQAKFGARRIRATIRNSKDIRATFEEYIELSHEERKAKRITNKDRINACKVFTDEIENKICNEAINMRGSELLAHQELLTDIANKQLELSNRLNGGKKSAQTKKIAKLEKEKEDNIDDYYCIDIHGFSVNYMYQYQQGKKVRSKAYSTWRQNMHWNMSRVLPVDYLGQVDFNQPVRLSLGYVALESFDIDNLVKSTQDALAEFYGFNDNIIWETKVKRIGVAESYEDGKIYVKIENI